ncbi:MAG: UDP-N-acetylmuramoyl-tripeptide--D-alanyl-D-alanine ligase [Brevefilum sp.]
MLSLQTVISALSDHKISPLDVRISSVVIDSRQAIEGSLFIALPGERVDGHDFVQAAFDNGAVLALVEKEMPDSLNTLDLREEYFPPEELAISTPLCLRVENTLSALQQIAAYWRRQHDIKVVGITGSVGKTSTKELTASLLSQKFTVLKNPGNRNNEIGLPLTLLELDPHHEVAVLEMGFYVPGEIRTLCEIAQPQIGVVSNIGTVHAERAGSQETIARGKAELVESLPEGPEGVAILNMDDPWVRWMANKTKADVFSYSVIEGAKLTASSIRSLGLEGIACNLTYQGKEYQVRSPLLGEFSAYTILRAVAVALVMGMSWEQIVEGLSVSRVDLRMRPFALPNKATLLDDTYNASPASTLAALKLLKGLQGRRVAILGDMLELGQYEEQGHNSVGAFATEAADVLVLVGDRSKKTAEAAMDKGFSKEKLHWFPNSEAAANPAAEIVQEGDVVLIKGSNSMRMDRIIARLEKNP